MLTRKNLKPEIAAVLRGLTADAFLTERDKSPFYGEPAEKPKRRAPKSRSRFKPTKRTSPNAAR